MSAEPRPEVRAGRVAELQVASILTDRFSGTPYEFVAGVRVPYKKGRREVDILITTPEEVWLVELKNWSGFVRFEDGRVIQHRGHGRGMVDHGRLLVNLRTKEGALKSYIKRETGAEVETRNFLVFCNESAGISEELLEIDDIIVAGLREFLSVLPAARADYGRIGRIFRGVFGGGNPEKEERREPVDECITRARKALAGLGTWDFLMLRGGRVLSGDVREISADGLYNRADFRSIRVDIPRGLLRLFGPKQEPKAVARKRCGEDQEFLVGVDDVVVFHAAGQPKPSTFRLREVESISFGSSGGGGRSVG